MSLSRLLQTQTTRLKELSRLLAQEQELLTAGQIEGRALEQVAQDKQTLLDALATTEKSRLSIQDRLGYPTDIEGSRQAAEDAGCLEEWQAMLELTRVTARQNQRNGYLISTRAQHNRQMLDYLQSIAEARPYTAKGRHLAGSGQLNASA
ncbi:MULTISPECIES: flagellar protein FlgN [unclassified Halomonas]|uniref:flagella synthesis protein FlgN n=1 Tax=unclassified Halomonas TaxID=2609666 RepID=UPI00288515DA|nr:MULTISPECIES: flagellar protein FlgN [unclassified Halomonas]MDT0500525.1 flagellar protein FlgN [Halomonas sp. PAR7]MDT0511579.1 flagellar protein FlgN [Halomonas sp. LES1]MDT0590133.1 flagellar protein FlgN [Halomonas sp. PAR8]